LIVLKEGHQLEQQRHMKIHAALSLLQNNTVIYEVLFLLASLFGIIWPPIFALHKIELPLKSEQSRNVVKSVTENGRNILRTALLGIISFTSML